MTIETVFAAESISNSEIDLAKRGFEMSAENWANYFISKSITDDEFDAVEVKAALITKQLQDAGYEEETLVRWHSGNVKPVATPAIKSFLILTTHIVRGDTEVFFTYHLFKVE